MKSESNQAIWSWSKLSRSKDSISPRSRRQERGQAHLPNPEVIKAVLVVFDRKAFKPGIYRATERASQVGKAGLPPLLTPAPQTD